MSVAAATDASTSTGSPINATTRIATRCRWFVIASAFRSGARHEPRPEPMTPPPTACLLTGCAERPNVGSGEYGTEVEAFQRDASCDSSSVKCDPQAHQLAPRFPPSPTMRPNEPSSRPRDRGTRRGRGLPARPADPPGTARLVVAARRRPRRHPPTVLAGAAPGSLLHGRRARPTGRWNALAYRGCRSRRFVTVTPPCCSTRVTRFTTSPRGSGMIRVCCSGRMRTTAAIRRTPRPRSSHFLTGSGGHCGYFPATRSRTTWRTR
jgi:hypothetical protein